MSEETTLTMAWSDANMMEVGESLNLRFSSSRRSFRAYVVTEIKNTTTVVIRRETYLEAVVGKLKSLYRRIFQWVLY